MPQMGVSVTEGTVVTWRVGVGERIEAEQTICEISTDKIDTEIPAPIAGVVAEILVLPEMTVAVGAVLARIAADGPRVVSGPAADGPGVASGPAGPPAEVPGVANGLINRVTGIPGAPDLVPGIDDGAPAVLAADGGRPVSRRFYSPVVQRVAADHGIDLDKVPGTGRGGRVRKEDLPAFLAGAPDAPDARDLPDAPDARDLPDAPDARDLPDAPDARDLPDAPDAPAPVGAGRPERAQATASASEDAGQLSRVRRQIGGRMKRSLETAAHCTTWIEVDMGRVQAARSSLGLTVLPFVAQSTVAALDAHPPLNASLDGERYTWHREVNLGIAVSLDQDGLVVPVIHRARELSVQGLAARIRELAQRARSGELTPDEVGGGTFTITNPGRFGTIMATPIINQPQVAILDLEAVVKRPVVVTDGDGNDSIAIRPIAILGLSWDHRALDGAQAAQFLASVKRHLEGWGRA